MEDINDVILFQIDKTSKVSKLYSQREFDKLDFGITIEQWILLKIIEESGQLSQKELAEKSLRDPASITRTLDILQKKGYITREAVENNRRQYHIILSNEGAQFVKKHMKVVKEHRAKSTEGFTTEEVELLRSMLLRIQKNFS
jgi:MarR family transcriptional regulator for hemolysin